MIESLDQRQLELLAHCGHVPAIERLGRKQTTYQFDGKTTVTAFVLEAWFTELSSWGLRCMVHAAIATTHEKLLLLERYPWLKEYSGPLLSAAEKWSFEPTSENAQLAHVATLRVEELADGAEESTTFVGDWFTREFVEQCGLIPAAIATDAGLLESESPNVIEDLVSVCNYFAMPSVVEDRCPFATRDVVCQRIISWLLP